MPHDSVSSVSDNVRQSSKNPKSNNHKTHTHNHPKNPQSGSTAGLLLLPASRAQAQPLTHRASTQKREGGGRGGSCRIEAPEAGGEGYLEGRWLPACRHSEGEPRPASAERGALDCPSLQRQRLGRVGTGEVSAAMLCAWCLPV